MSYIDDEISEKLAEEGKIYRPVPWPLENIFNGKPN